MEWYRCHMGAWVFAGVPDELRPMTVLEFEILVALDSVAWIGFFYNYIDAQLKIYLPF